MFRRSIAGLILGPSLMIGSLAWAGFIALRTAFEPDRSRQIAGELLDNDEVRAQLTDNLGRAIEAALPEGAAVSSEVVDAAATTVLDDPRVEALILDAFGSTHAAFLGEGEPPETLDLTPVVESARSTLESASPGLAALLPDDEAFVVDLPTERIPDASPVRRFLQNTVPYLAAIAVVGALLALLSTSHRPSILTRAARWAFATTAVYLVIGLGIPWLLRQFAPDQAEVFAALLTAVLRATLVPSIVLAACGVALLVVAAVWPEGDRRRKPARRPAPAPQPAPITPVAPAPRAAPRPSPPAAAPAPPAAAAPPTSRIVAAPPTPAPPLPASVRAPRSVPPDIAPARPARSPFPTREGASAASRFDAADDERWLPPTWVEGHGWVLDPDDPKPPPPNARWVEGVGFVVPGPPPDA